MSRTTDTATIELVINSQQAQKKLEEINRSLETARQRKLEAFEKGDAKALQLYTREVQRLERQSAQLESRAQTVTRTLGQLDRATPKQLRTTIRELNRELNSGAVERGSEQWDTLTRALRQANTELAAVRVETRAARQELDKGGEGEGNFLSNFGKKWVGIFTLTKGAIEGARAVFNSALSTLQSYADDYAELAEHMAGVTKYTGLAKEEVDGLNEAFKQMDTRTTRAALNDLAADAGRLGIQGKEQILEFVEAADQINVALGEDLGQDAVRNIGKLAQLFGDADSLGLKQAMLATGSVINELAQSSSANEGYIMDFTARLAGMARQAGMTQAQVMGLASVMDQSMVRAEEGSTALSKLLQNIYRQPAKMAQAVGLEAGRFTQLVRTDINAALLEFAQAVQKLGGMEKVAPVLGDISMTGAGVTKAIAALANNIDNVRASQEQATEAFREATSVTDEFNMANSTVQARLDKARNAAASLRAELGEALLPVYERGLAASNAATAALTTLIAFTLRHAAVILPLAAAIAVFTARLALATAAQRVWTATLALGRSVAAGFRAAVGLVHVGFIALTQGTRAATVALKALKIQLLANPYTAAATAILAVAAAVYMWVTRTKELSAAEKQRAAIQRDLTDMQQAAAEGAARETARVRTLTTVIHDNARSIDERRAAVEALRKIIPQYNAEISREGRITRENTQAVNDYIEAVKRKAQAQALEEKLTSLQGQTLTAEDSRRRRQNALNKRRRDLEAVKRTIAPKDLAKYNAMYGDPNYMYVIQRAEHNPNPDTDFGRYYRLLYLVRQAEAWVKEQDDILAVLNGRTDSLMKTAEEVGVKFDDILAAGSPPAAPPAPAAGTDTPHPTPKAEDPAERIRRETEAQLTAQKVAYNNGLTSLQQYEDETFRITLEGIGRRQALHAKGSAEWNKAELERQEAEKAQRDKRRAWSEQEIKADQEAGEKAARDRYLQGKASEEQYQQELDSIRLRALQRRKDYTKEQAESLATPDNLRARQEAERAYQEESDRQQEAKRRDFLQRVEQLRSQYLQAPLERQREAEEAFLDTIHRQGLASEEEYQQMKLAIREKYDRLAKERAEGSEKANPRKRPESVLGMPQDPMASALISLYDSIAALDAPLKEGEQKWERYAKVAVQSLALVSAAIGSVSQLFQAQQQAEEAKVTARYDKEIEAAGATTAKGKKLEEQKQKELARVKNKYNKKEMTVQLAQAVAQTAMNALMAYGAMAKIPVVGPALGIAAAAAATAAGMIQIAAIKKQHEAQAAGYYEGGYTGDPRHPRRIAGVVHGGEFVASARAVRNPALRPVLDLIDHAQRTRTVASLTPADVSRAVAAPAATAQAATRLTQAYATAATAPPAPHTPAPAGADTTRELAQAAQAQAQAALATARQLRRLTDTLDQGITATAQIDGPQGIARQLQKYRRLTNT